jgi:hypothetical protein
MKREGKEGRGREGRRFSQLLTSSYNPLDFEPVRAPVCSEMSQHKAPCSAQLSSSQRSW